MSDLDVLIAGERGHRRPCIPWHRTLRSLWGAHAILRVYDRRGEPVAFEFLRRLPCPNRGDWCEVEALLVARHLSATVQVFLRLRYPGALCVPRSLAVCAALRRAGLPAQVVIGRRLVRGGQVRFANTAQGFDFHAWVELDGQVLTDAPVSKLGYAKLVTVPRVPQQEPVPHAT